ncbi:MAG: hypothetical protein Ct9H300mP28_29970 [Pseudomonadota bacterium]|nr:MAG: hypothetical protein Ct9H300mP28_29970 [Pseudomonadota bacterium]
MGRNFLFAGKFKPKILVDEYQDTNKVQAEILLLLSGQQNNLMVVGDDAQSIYSWRGADFGNMLEFPEKYKAVTYYMEENYRSSPEILDAANQSINYKHVSLKKTSLVRFQSEKNL